MFFAGLVIVLGGAEMLLRGASRIAARLRHFGQVRSGSALIDWNTSQPWPHFVHSYS